MSNIAKALLTVQANLEPVRKSKAGYGYKYADLSSVMDACMAALNAAGVVMVQAPDTASTQAACIITRLIHADSGEEITSRIEVPFIEQAKMSVAQSYGSAMTYARRYALVSMLGIPLEDDDAAARLAAPKPAPVVDVSAKAIEWAVSYANKRADAEDKVGLDGEHSAAIARAVQYPAAKAILEMAGVPL